MRALARPGPAAAALALLGLAGLLALAPRLLGSEALRRRIEAVAGERLGVELRCERLALGWLPPRLELRGLRVSQPEIRGPALLEAEGAELRVALWPLLERRIVADLELEGARLRLADLELRGPLHAAVELSGPPGAAAGRFELEATRAEVEYAGAFSKPDGAPARVSGRILTGPEGALAVEDVRVTILNPHGEVLPHQVPK